MMNEINENELVFETNSQGEAMFALCEKLFPICRSITGAGFRQSLELLNNELGGIMQMHSIKSGTKVFDWVVPPEWNCEDAYIITPDGEKICDFKVNNLHLMGYSTPIDAQMSLDELNEHLYSLESLPNAIPYITSYYERRWGFCISHNERKRLKKGIYKVYINSKLDENGVLNYADLVIPATTKSKDEVLISSYLCHPSMANNELSGPVVATFLAKALLQGGGGCLATAKNTQICGVNFDFSERKFNYRFIFIPETIGSIVYLSQHLKHLQKRVKAGFALSCCADDNAYTLLHSPKANTLADKIGLHTLQNKTNFKAWDFTFRGSDERQYCSPRVNLPVVSIQRTCFSDECYVKTRYHTSLDDLSYVSANGFGSTLKAMCEIISNLEINAIYKNTIICEPYLSKRNLYPTLSTAKPAIEQIINFLAFCDENNDVIDIANKLKIQAYELKECINALLKHKLIKKVKR